MRPITACFHKLIDHCALMKSLTNVLKNSQPKIQTQDVKYVVNDVHNTVTLS